jgi:hypothetical protein
LGIATIMFSFHFVSIFEQKSIESEMEKLFIDGSEKMRFEERSENLDALQIKLSCCEINATIDTHQDSLPNCSSLPPPEKVCIK